MAIVAKLEESRENAATDSFATMRRKLDRLPGLFGETGHRRRALCSGASDRPAARKSSAFEDQSGLAQSIVQGTQTLRQDQRQAYQWHLRSGRLWRARDGQLPEGRVSSGCEFTTRPSLPRAPGRAWPLWRPAEAERSKGTGQQLSSGSSVYRARSRPDSTTAAISSRSGNGSVFGKTRPAITSGQLDQPATAGVGRVKEQQLWPNS